LGFGVYRYLNGSNRDWPFKTLTLTRGDDCKVYSSTSEFRKIADPDSLNPGPISVWSFATGCNSFWGDSGGPSLDLESGLAVGVFWTLGTPKLPLFQDRSNLDFLLKSQSEEIWKGLSYAVPASKIKESIRSLLTSDVVLDEDRKATLTEFIR
jgi:hypothetical protein